MLRPAVLALSLLSLSLLGGKCKGPKPPKAAAADAVEEAWWVDDVKTSLEDGQMIEIQVDVELTGSQRIDAVATITFEREGDQTSAFVALDGQAYAFEVSPRGEAIPQ